MNGAFSDVTPRCFILTTEAIKPDPDKVEGITGVLSELRREREQQSVRKESEEPESTGKDKRDNNNTDRAREEKRGRKRTAEIQCDHVVAICNTIQ